MLFNIRNQIYKSDLMKFERKIKNAYEYLLL